MAVFARNNVEAPRATPMSAVYNVPTPIQPPPFAHPPSQQPAHAFPHAPLQPPLQHLPVQQQHAAQQQHASPAPNGGSTAYNQNQHTTSTTPQRNAAIAELQQKYKAVGQRLLPLEEARSRTNRAVIERRKVLPQHRAANDAQCQQLLQYQHRAPRASGNRDDRVRAYVCVRPSQA